MRHETAGQALTEISMNYIRDCSFEQLQQIVDFLVEVLKLKAESSASGTSWSVDCWRCKRSLALRLRLEESRLYASCNEGCPFQLLLSDFKDFNLLKPHQKIMPISATELLQTKLPTRQMLLGKWMPEKTSVLIAGESGTGKSYFAMTLLCAIASGGSCFEWSAPKSLKVGIFDGELPEIDIQERLKSISLDGKSLGNISIVTRDRYMSENLVFPDFTDSSQVTNVLEMFSGVDVLLVDNVNCCFSGKDENSSGFWEAVQRLMFMCRERGMALILIHHCPKSRPNKPSGHSKNERAFEKLIVLSKILPPAKLEGAHFNVHFDKNRHRPNGTKDFSARLVNDVNGISSWEMRDFINQSSSGNSGCDESLRKEISELHKSGLSLRKIQDKVGVSRSTVQRILSKVSHVSAGQAETDETSETSTRDDEINV